MQGSMYPMSSASTVLAANPQDDRPQVPRQDARQRERAKRSTLLVDRPHMTAYLAAGPRPGKRYAVRAESECTGDVCHS